ncbi:MAG TPA: metal-dependent transcriptional regulator [Bacteroidia bacterium]|nr:metal-dependent transcriptional regulator [Bacteroidia bacterium]
MYSFTEENYLKALFNLADKKGEANVKELSKHLGIKMSTVTSMMKKLSEKGMVHYKSYQPLHLTEKGKKEAGLIIRKHRLTEMFLFEKMGFRWDEVHEIAEQIEHIHSPKFFEKMDGLLGFPKVDPHGSPIPDKNGKMILKEYKKLSDCKAGETIKICAVINSSDDFLRFLDARNLHLGTKIKIHSIEAFDKSMLISYGKKTSETLSHTASEKLLVDKA